ncbi:siderophore-interacting protein, partial [Neisseria dentiae]|uniref:siderophore-interacting protein n=1 Tax=Neisseria dentiae TaxID=194197 RepID=UPI0035A0511C
MTNPNNNDPHRIRLIRVQSWHDVGKHLRRIVFNSPELADYPFRCNGAPFKLLLPREGKSAPVLPESFEKGRPRWADPADKPYSRTYTVRAFNRQACTFT